MAVFLSPRLLPKARHATSSATVFVAESWEELEAILKHRPIDTALVDPIADGTPQPQRIASLQARFTSISFVVYATVTAESFSAVAKMQNAPDWELMIEGYDDSPRHFFLKANIRKKETAVMTVLEILRKRLAHADPALSLAIYDLFSSPITYATAGDLELKANMSTANLYRAFARAGLGSPKRLLTAAKVLWGVTYLMDESARISDVAEKVGYLDARVFRKHFQRIFGECPSAVRGNLSSEMASQRVIDWLRNRRQSGPSRGTPKGALRMSRMRRK